jgi:hypothetical protein
VSVGSYDVVSKNTDWTEVRKWTQQNTISAWLIDAEVDIETSFLLVEHDRFLSSPSPDAAFLSSAPRRIQLAAWEPVSGHASSEA